MKKLILTLAAVAAFGTAMAQTFPFAYNYQGVCTEKNAEIKFVYSFETPSGAILAGTEQTVATDENGLFNVILDAPTAEELTSDVVTLRVSINGEEVANNLVVATPYATVAEKFLDQENILGYINGRIDRIESMTPASEDDIDYLMDVVQGLQEAQRNNASVADVVELQDQMEMVTSDVQGIQETLRGKANVSDVTELQDQMEMVTSDVQGIQETLRGKANVSDVTELQDQMEIVSGDLQGVVESLRGKANVEDVVALQDAMEYVTSDVQGIQETLRGKANVSDVVALQEAVETFQSTNDKLAKQVKNLNTVMTYLLSEQVDAETAAAYIALLAEND